MKTAVEFLVKEFSDMLGPLDIKPMQDLLLVDAIKRAKEMEKEQIIEAFAKGSNEESDYHGFQFITPDKAIEYYNETFKQ